MKRLWVWAAVAVLLVGGCGGKKAHRLSMADKINHVGKTDREKNGLVGPVHKVVVENAALSARSGKPVEGRSWRSSVRVFGPDGKVAKISSYGPDGSETSKTVFLRSVKGGVRTVEMIRYVKGALRSRMVDSYNAKGKSGETLHYGANGKLVGRQVSTFDDAGHVIRLDFYKANGSLESKLVPKYNASGDQTEWAWYTPDGSPVSRTTMTYDANGNGTEMCEYGYAEGSSKEQLASRTVTKPLAQGNGYEEMRYYGDGTLRDRSISRFDAHWNPTERIEYDAKGRLKSKLTHTYDAKGNALTKAIWNTDGSLKSKTSYAYTFDSRGNWVKQIRSEIAGKSSKSQLLPVEVMRRTITYY